MKRSITSLLGAAGLLAVNATAAPVAYDGHWYDIVPAAGIAWADAKAAAEGMILSVGSALDGSAGYLATSTSAAENAFIESLRVGAGLGQSWLGGFQPSGETTPGAGWSWITGEDWDCFVKWASGEPNDFYGSASEQQVAIGLFGSGTWNDEGALGLISGYVVEWGPNRACVPDGGSVAAISMLTLAGLAGIRRKFGAR